MSTLSPSGLFASRAELFSACLRPGACPSRPRVVTRAVATVTSGGPAPARTSRSPVRGEAFPATAS
jgi:hypothetical protein